MNDTTLHTYQVQLSVGEGPSPLNPRRTLPADSEILTVQASDGWHARTVAMAEKKHLNPQGRLVRFNVSFRDKNGRDRKVHFTHTFHLSGKTDVTVSDSTHIELHSTEFEGMAWSIPFHVEQLREEDKADIKNAIDIHLRSL